MERFTDLEVWKRGCRLTVKVHEALATTREYGFKDQVTRAALSIPSNVAEGYDRGSTAEYIQFLNYAKGSCAELRTQLYIGMKIGVVEKAQSSELIDEAAQITRMLQSMVNTLTNPEP